MKSKYKCPKCGSTELCLSEQTVTEKKYRLRKNGDPYTRAFETMYDVADMIKNIECMVCCNSCNLEDRTEIEKWVNT